MALATASLLPPLIATNFMLAVALGYFIFKAGYAQPELLFYFLFFVTYVASIYPLKSGGGRHDITLGACAGTCAGLAYVTKAVVPPLVVRSYTGYWYYKYVLLYLVFSGVLLTSNAAATRALLRRRPFVAVFLLGYAAIYLPAIAFFSVTSGTGTGRFFIAHLAPLLFTLSLIFAAKPFADTRWRVGRLAFGPGSFHVVVFALWGFDLTFTIWPRLLSTYGGF